MTENDRNNNGPRRFLVRPGKSRNDFRQTALRLHTALTGKDPTAEDVPDVEKILDWEFGAEEAPPEPLQG